MINLFYFVLHLISSGNWLSALNDYEWYSTNFLFIHSSVAVQSFFGFWPLFQFLNPIHSRKDSLDEGISPSQSRYLHTEQHKHRINAHIYIHALSGFRTDDSNVRASEDSSCLRPRGHCERHEFFILLEIFDMHYSRPLLDYRWKHLSMRMLLT
jgi:hypothetical protein